MHAGCRKSAEVRILLLDVSKDSINIYEIFKIKWAQKRGHLFRGKIESRYILKYMIRLFEMIVVAHESI